MIKIKTITMAIISVWASLMAFDAQAIPTPLSIDELLTDKPLTDETSVITQSDLKLNDSSQPATITKTKLSSAERSALITHYQILAKQQQLASHKVWQRLFYVNNKHISRVEYQDFFLHPKGKQDLALELDETIAQLINNDGERSPQCRFPARTKWLTDQLGISPEVLAQVDCSEFNTWYQQINPHTMTLIFASDYMGNPGSMFGHSLLRLDPVKDPNKNMDLVAYVLNYAAMTPPNENSAAYALKGLTGKYSGEYSLMRYFHKTKEYGDLESRDMWEYELSLTPEEVSFLVRHIWEMKNVRFPYYFMDKNCSYALLGLVDLVRPELDLQDKFHWTVVPIETVKAIKNAGLIRDTHYRPALETHLKTQERQHGQAFGRLAHRLTLPKISPQQEIAQQEAKQQAGLLEMAYDDLYLQHANKKTDNSFAQARLRELLVLRSQLDVPKQRITPKRPNYDPSQGHGDKSWGINVGQMQGEPMVTLHHRTAYHGFSDPFMGYATGQLLFLNGAVSVTEDKVRLDHLDLLSVHAVNPITSYKRPRSWGADFGFRQVAVDDNGQFSTKQTHGVGIMAAQMGYAKSLLADKLVCGAYARGELQLGKALDKGVHLGISPKLHCTARLSDNLQGVASINAPYWQDSQQWQIQSDAELQYNLNPNHALRLTGTHESQNGQSWHKLSLGYHWYY